MSVSIITTSLPNGVVGTAYSQTVQQFGGQAPLVYTISTGALPAGLSIAASTGVISGTPTTAALYNFTVLLTDNNSDTDTQAFSVRTYAALNPAPDPISPATRVVVDAGAQLDFSATGGSGEYSWSVDGGNLINPSTGLLTAVNGGNYTVTLVDEESGQIATILITITSQNQFCVDSTAVFLGQGGGDDPCCEFNVECGDRLQLRVPSFHLVENGDKRLVSYSNLVQTVTGEASALRSTSVSAGAAGNPVSFARNAYFEIVTSFDMAQTANGEFGIGFSNDDIDSNIDSIEHGVVWFTNTGVRKVEVRHSGTVEAASQFDIAQGDVVSFGNIDGELQLWINSVPAFTSAESPSACGDVVLDVSIAGANKSIGGYVENLSWSIVTAGAANVVGSIDAGGVYTAPANPIAGIIQVLGNINSANFYVNLRNIQPTPKFQRPDAFLAGRRAHVWVTNRRATDTDIIRIASDGSPDALQNPGMIYLGVLEASATFAEEIEYQNFDNDEGTYYVSVATEKASLTGTFLEVRDLDKLALLMQHSTLYPQAKGVTEIGVGGKACGSCDLRVALIVETGACGSGWDVIYLPRAQNTANLSLEIGRKTPSKFALNFRVLPDSTRPVGKQLYSIYQMGNCGSGADDAVTCG